MLSHINPKLYARAKSNKQYGDSTIRKGPQPTTERLAKLLRPGPRIGSITIYHSLLKSLGCEKNQRGSSVQLTAEPKSRNMTPVPTAKPW